jgi:hypothetical protein
MKMLATQPETPDQQFLPFLRIFTVLRWFCQKLHLKHLSSKYQVMNEMQSFNAERNFITNTKLKLKKCL